MRVVSISLALYLSYYLSKRTSPRWEDQVIYICRARLLVCNSTDGQEDAGKQVANQKKENPYGYLTITFLSFFISKTKNRTDLQNITLQSVPILTKCQNTEITSRTEGRTYTNGGTGTLNHTHLPLSRKLNGANRTTILMVVANSTNIMYTIQPCAF